MWCHDILQPQQKHYFKAQNAKNSKMGQTVLCMYDNHITPDLLIYTVDIPIVWTRHSLCIQSSSHARCYILYQNVICILPQKIGFVSPPKHMKQDCTEELFKGKRLKFTCLHCKLQINFLCCAEHTGLAWFLRQCTWASSFWTMWNKAQQSQVGGCSRWLSRGGRETPLVSTALLNPG